MAHNQKLGEKFTSFNMFMDDGRNHVIHTNKPMTTLEAMYKYHALSIGGII